MNQLFFRLICILESTFLTKQELYIVTLTKLRVQHLAAGKNLSFNQFQKQRVLFFFPRETYFIEMLEHFFTVYT